MSAENPRKLRVALIGSRGVPATYSGFETFYEQLGSRLAERGHEITVYNRSHHVQYDGQTYKGMRLVRLPAIRSKHLDTLSHTALSLVHALFQRYDLIYVCIVGNAPLCILPRLAGIPVLLNVDGDDSAREKWKGLAKRYLRWSERVAGQLATCLIADAVAIREKYLANYGRESVFIPYGSNVWPRERESENFAVLERFGLQSDRYVLFCSRLTPENRADVAIRAFLKSDLPPDMKLVIVGDAPYADDYRRQVHELADGNRVVCTGYLFGDDYRQISCHARFFVLPSGIDGTRPGLLDQLGFGNAVIVRNSTVNRAVIGDAGLHFEGEREVESLAEQMSRLNRDSNLVLSLRAAASERARTEFSWEAVTDQYESLFHSVVKKKNRSTSTTDTTPPVKS